MLVLLLACETDGNSLFSNWNVSFLFFFLDTVDAMNHILLSVAFVKKKVGSAYAVSVRSGYCPDAVDIVFAWIYLWCLKTSAPVPAVKVKR